MAEYLVDVVAAARRLNGAHSAQEKAAEAAGADCPLGHANAAGARFCGDCGMPMESVELEQRVDLDAVRAAVLKPLTADEKARREAEHLAVLQANAMAERQLQDITQIADPSDKQVLIHFVDDGFTALGKVWQRGEMLQMGPDHPMWGRAVGWIRLTKRQQFERYGRIFWDFGPWPGADLPAGTERPLGSAPPSRWAETRSRLPAAHANDGTSALSPF